MMSSGGMPYFSVSSWYERSRDGQFALARERLRLQLVLVDRARPPAPRRKRFAIGQTRSNFSSPSSRLIELMMLLPWQ